MCVELICYPKRRIEIVCGCNQGTVDSFCMSVTGNFTKMETLFKTPRKLSPLTDVSRLMESFRIRQAGSVCSR